MGSAQADAARVVGAQVGQEHSRLEVLVSKMTSEVEDAAESVVSLRTELYDVTAKEQSECNAETEWSMRCRAEAEVVDTLRAELVASQEAAQPGGAMRSGAPDEALRAGLSSAIAASGGGDGATAPRPSGPEDRTRVAQPLSRCTSSCKQLIVL